MAKILTYTNILNPLERQTKEIEASTAYEILDRLNINTTLYEVVIAKNQVIIDEDFEIQKDDIVSISLVPLGGGGGGKDVLRVVAMIAVAVTAPYLAGAMVTSFGAMTGITYGATAALSANAIVAAGITIAGGMLVNAIMPPQVPSVGDLSIAENLESSPTYSWDTRGNQIEQGKPVPILYGKHRVTPPQISQYVETIGNLQYLNVLYAVADGETQIDTSTIKINNEPISNYKDVEIYTRDGKNDQTMIGLFDDVHTDTAIDKKLTTEWAYKTTNGNSVSGLEIGLVAPSGIWYVNDSGGMSNYTVRVEVQYYYDEQWIPLAIHSKTRQVTNILGYWARGTIKEAIPSSSWWGNEYRYVEKYLKFATHDEALYFKRRGRLERYNEPDLVVLETADRLPSNCMAMKSTSNNWDGYDNYDGTFEQRESYSVVDDYLYDEITSNKQQALRKSYKVEDLPKGAYEIRARFYQAPTSGSRYGSTMYLSYLQETVTDDFTYPNTALLGIKLLATDQLSGSMPTVSVVAQNEMNNPSDACKDILIRSGEKLSNVELEKY